MTYNLESVIRSTMPGCKDPAGWSVALQPAMEKFYISADINYVAAFLSQIAVESAEMNRLEENLHYTAKRLVALWPKRFPTQQDAEPFAGNPRALANHVYGGRMGNTIPGDGWKYRGRGLKMITGRDNYARMSSVLGYDFVSDPDLLLEQDLAALSAAAFWGSPHDRLSSLAADLPDDDQEQDFETITRIINGGTNGLAMRKLYWVRAKKALGIEPATVVGVGSSAV